MSNQHPRPADVTAGRILVFVVFAGVLVLAIVLCVTSNAVRAGAVEPPTRMVGYYTGWSTYQRNFQVAQIPAGRLTHINYAFANIQDGRVVLGDRYADVEKAFQSAVVGAEQYRGNFGQLRLLKRQQPRLKTMISIGGWTWSSPFSDVARTAASRDRFAGSAVAFLRQHGFDGVDIDWEYPVAGGKPGNVTRPEDRENFTELLARLRTALDTAGEADHCVYELTIAAPAGASHFRNLELGKIHRSLSFINLMTYDYHGGWERRTNFNAPLFAASDDPSSAGARAQYNVAATVTAYLKAGVPADKLVVGVPFFGRGWQGVDTADNGLFQAATGTPRGSWEAGVFDYKDLASNYLGNGYSRYWHRDSQVPWLYNAKTRIMISYDDAESLTRKARFVKSRKLGGVMVWELSADDRRQTLLGALHAGLLPNANKRR